MRPPYVKKASHTVLQDDGAKDCLAMLHTEPMADLIRKVHSQKQLSKS